MRSIVGIIHAYGFRSDAWGGGESGVEVIYSGLKYEIPDGEYVINQVVYKNFPSPLVNVSPTSYMWFFTKTPRDKGVAALNA